MTTKKEASRDAFPVQTTRRVRKHAYRGYGSGFQRGTDSYGGAIHFGTGFAGVGKLEPRKTREK